MRLGSPIVALFTEKVFGDLLLVGHSVAATVLAAGYISITSPLGDRKTYRETIAAVESY